MKLILSTVAAMALGVAVGGCSSDTAHHDASASSSSHSEWNHGMAGGTGTMGEDPVHPGAYTEGGTARIEDHRNDAGNRDARPAAERQYPDDDDSGSRPDQNGLGDSD